MLSAILFISCYIQKKENLRHLFLIIVAITGLGMLSVGPKLGLEVLDMNHFTKYSQFFVLGVLSARYRELYKKVVGNEQLKAIALISFFAT